jgi:hypothetical protein
MDFLKITNEVLDNIDLSKTSKKINSAEYQNYFISNSGKEHYRLLSYISEKNDFINFLDIGTLKGCSALAFSTNPNNKVYSFNLSDELDLSNPPSNIDFFIDNVIKNKYDDLIIKSKYIMLDTYHDGVFEKQFYDYLKSINYKGFLLLDDIYLNNEMTNFWKKIEKNKSDITHIGHMTGTGVVFFD